MEGCSFLKALEVKRYIKRYVKMSCKWLSFFIGGLLGNILRICFLGLFERKGKYVLVNFLDPENIHILSLRTISNFSNGRGPF